MELDIRAFPFIISLAAVINGLGIVRLLGTFAELLRKRHTLQIRNYWVYNAQVLRVSDSPKLHAVLVPANLVVVVFHILVYAMPLGGVSAMLE